ncbi:MAG: hypothetical protein R3F33_10415 [Planctomycetota bacterium]
MMPGRATSERGGVLIGPRFGERAFQLRQEGPDRLVWRATAALRLLHFVIFGLAVAAVLAIGLQGDVSGTRRGVVFGGALGMAILGFWLFRSQAAPIVLDRRAGTWSQGDKVLRRLDGARRIVVLENPPEVEPNVTTWQIQVHYSGGQASLLMDQVDGAQSRRDAERVAEFLGLELDSHGDPAGTAPQGPFRSV